MSETTAKAAAFWDNVSKQPRPKRTRWWESKAINRHINAKVCGHALDGIHAGFHRLLAEAVGGSANRAISVGGGVGHKEMVLLRAGIVDRFDLYEISLDRINTGQARAVELGLSDRIVFHQGDAFQEAIGSYDLVYWNNSLHHMPEVTAAIAWSHERLSTGGVFAMDEFVGPTRFQWTDRNLHYAEAYRRALAPEQLVSPRDPSKPVRPIIRPTIEAMLAMDPSEAADSSSITGAFTRYFPHGMLRYTGGSIYHLALNDVLANLEEDSSVLSLALVLDDALSEMGENHYAVGIGIKE